MFCSGHGAGLSPCSLYLYGVLCHHGTSAGEGRYTLDVLRQNPFGGASSAGVTGSGSGSGGERSLQIDDETVGSVRHGDVFRHSNGTGKEPSDDRCAYLIFYRRAALART